VTVRYQKADYDMAEAAVGSESHKCLPSFARCVLKDSAELFPQYGYLIMAYCSARASTGTLGTGEAS
jgi:hypothetical protein